MSMHLPSVWQVKKIQTGINETLRLIEKEERYPIDLQKPDRLAFLYGHLTHLNKMLETGEGLPQINC